GRMKKDQLIVYAASQRASIYFQLGAALVFIALKYWWYGLPLKPATREMDLAASLRDAIFAGASLYMIVRQMGVYKHIVTMGEKRKNAEAPKYVTELGIYKILFIIPWSLLLFQPALLWEKTSAGTISAWPHLLGYIYVFSAIAAFASASAALLPLLVL